MKVFVSHSSGCDFINNLYKPLRSSQINKDHKIFLPHENNKNVLTKDIIKNSDVVIAEVSYSSTGQGIELGWANIFNIPIICIYQNTTKPSGSLKYITKTIVTYKDAEEMIKKLTDALDRSS